MTSVQLLPFFLGAHIYDTWSSLFFLFQVNLILHIS